MKKGIEFALFRKVKVDNRTGKVVQDEKVWLRPPHGVKVLAQRKAQRKAAKQARKRNR